MAKSLRWRLQVWHAAILASVIIGFAAVLYLQIRRTTFGDIDAELLGGARVLDASLKPMPPLGFRPDPRPGFRPDSGPGPRRRPPGEPERPPHRFNSPPPLADLPPPGFRDGRLSLPRTMLYRYGSDDPLPYFAVFSPHGDQIAGSYEDEFGPPIQPQSEYEFRNRGGNRELWLRGSGGRIILVGRDIRPQLDGLNRLVVPIGLSGLVVLAVGLVGGWWLTGRAIEPLHRISETVTSITAQSLTSRIDVAKMDTELEHLGSLLNSMLQRLEDSFEQQTRFVADASHELRTPISVLSMHCELALSRERKPDEYQRTLVTCARASERMRSLVEDLLILARADAGQLMQRQDSIDLSLIVDESVQLLMPLANQHRVTVETQLSQTHCRGDSNHLLRLTSNLLSNAILYNQPQGTVVVQVDQDSQHAILTITDTGSGMSPDEVDRLFERFYRVDEDRSRQTGGSGLGLSICQSIAVAHGGRLLVSSEKGVGTRAAFYLPLVSTSRLTDITAPLAVSSSR